MSVPVPRLDEKPLPAILLLMTDDIIGRTITDCRWMTKAELQAEDWDSHERVLVLTLDNGVKLYPSGDEEGNHGGALFGNDKGTQFFIMPGKK